MSNGGRGLLPCKHLLNQLSIRVVHLMARLSVPRGSDVASARNQSR
jgi:hypothetical protein